MAVNMEAWHLFQVQQDLRHPDAAVREKAAAQVIDLMLYAKHPVIHARVVALVSERVGCDVIQSESRDRLTGISRTPAAARVGRAAAQ